jgi:hypothetical protein
MKNFFALQLGKIKVGVRHTAGDSIIQCSEFYGTGVWDSIFGRAWYFTVLHIFHMDWAPVIMRPGPKAGYTVSSSMHLTNVYVRVDFFFFFPFV